MYKNFEDIVKKDNPKLHQNGQLKIVVDIEIQFHWVQMML